MCVLYARNLLYKIGFILGEHAEILSYFSKPKKSGKLGHERVVIGFSKQLALPSPYSSLRITCNRFGSCLTTSSCKNYLKLLNYYCEWRIYWLKILHRILSIDIKWLLPLISFLQIPWLIWNLFKNSKLYILCFIIKSLLELSVTVSTSTFSLIAMLCQFFLFWYLCY